MAKRYEEILEQVCEVLAPFVEDGHALAEDSQLVADLGLDSVQVMELLTAVEDRFDISIPLNILPDVRTVRDFALQVQRLTCQS